MIRKFFKVLYIFAISAILFTFKKPQFEVFVLLICLSWIMLLLSYGRKCNKSLISNFAGISLGMICGYTTIQIMNEGIFNIGIKSEFLIGICIINVLMILIMNTDKKNTTKGQSYEELFPARKYDLERIEYFILNTPVLGVNSIWGNGKSFVISHLINREKIREAFEVIHIDLLTCNLDEIEITLINEFERILAKNRIFANNSKEIKRVVGNHNFLKQIQSVFFDDSQSVSSDFGKLKDDVEKLDKKVLIIYEDIDRISNPEIIKKVFAISERISGYRIHVVYQYDQENLEKCGLSREYVEKYIPHVVNLTEMDFREIVKCLWEEVNLDRVGLTQQEFLFSIYGFPHDLHIEQHLELRLDFKILFNAISIRRVHIFMEECKLLMQSNSYFLDERICGTLIKVLFIKNFCYHQFIKFEFNKPIEQTMVFTIGEKEYTLDELMKEKRRERVSKNIIEKIFNIPENIEALAILMFLGYKVVDKEKPVRKKRIDVIDIDVLSIKENNERINRIINNVLGNGKSEYTDSQAVIKKLEQEVLCLQDSSEIKIAWKKFSNDLFYSKTEKDNKTVFVFGEGPLLSLFKSLATIGGSKEQWIKFLRLQEAVEDKKVITKTRIAILNCCDLNYKEVFLKAIELFTGCEVVGNLNENEEYKSFLGRYTGGIFRLGYSRSVYFESHNTELFSLLPDRLEESIKLLESMINIIESEKEYLFIEQAKDECDLIITFLKKNVDIIKFKEPVRIEPFPKFETFISAKRQNQEEFDRLMGLISEETDENSIEKFYKEVAKCYEQDKIIPADLHDLIAAFNKVIK